MMCNAQSTNWVACTSDGTTGPSAQPVYQFSGSGSSSGNFSNNPSAGQVLYPVAGAVITNPWYFDAEVDCGNSNVYEMDPNCGTASIYGTQQADAYFIWSANDQPAPASQSFVVNVQQYIYTTNPQNVTGGASDSFGLTDTVNDLPNESNMFTASGSYLVTVPVSCGIADVRDTSVFGGSVFASDVDGYAFVSPYETINSVTPDPRSISINASTFHKGPNNTQVANGPGVGDTIYSTETNGTVNGNWVDFTPAFTGTWAKWGPPTTPTNYDPNDPSGSTTETVGAPAVTWSWSPNESKDWEMYGTCEMPVSSGSGDTVYNVQYSASPLKTTPVTAEATFDMNLHQPAENIVINPITTQYPPIGSGVGPTAPAGWTEYSSFNGPPLPATNYNSFIVQGFSSSATATSLNVQGEYSAEFDTAVKQSVSATLGYTSTTTLTESLTSGIIATCQAGKEAFIFWAPAQTLTTGTVDAYGPSGFLGTPTWSLYTPNTGPTVGGTPTQPIRFYISYVPLPSQ